jgi:hypothetical protein
VITLKTATTMQQKIILIRYFCIGISVLFLLVGCGKETIEYRMNVDLVYINETNGPIAFEIFEKISSNNTSFIELNPSEKSRVFSYDYERVTKKLNPETCCNDFLPNAYSSLEWNGSSKKLFLKDSTCIIHLNNRSTEISNYEVEVVSPRHFRYTYTFTHLDIEFPRRCD